MGTLRHWLGPIIACSLIATEPACPQAGLLVATEPASPHAGQVAAKQTDRTEQYRLVKQFDFDERGQGNFEKEPMHWAALRGNGLPAFNRGQFDDRVGHDAPPSFRLDVQTSNIAYEYDHLDLTIVPGSDYVIRGHIRAAGLHHSRAFIAAYLVDRFGDRVAGSEGVSNLVRSPEQSTAGAAERWEPVELTVPGQFASAFALRIQCWVLHAETWAAPHAGGVDPIVRHDINGTAWFDDIRVYRLPRARLRLSNPSGVVVAGQPASLIVDVNNATAQDITAAIAISDMQRRVLHSVELDVPRLTASEWATSRASRDRHARPAAAHDHVGAGVRTPIPTLPPGIYLAQMRLRSDQAVLLEREVRFAVLSPLPPASRQSDIGIDMGPWRGGETAGAVELLSELGVGAARIGIPMVADDAGGPASSRLHEIGELVRELSKRRIESIGTMLPPELARESQSRATLRRGVLSDPTWRSRFGAVFAHFAGTITTWQLGDDAAELQFEGDWSPELLSAMRETLRRFVTAPRVVVPTAASNASPRDDAALSVLVPPGIPTRDIPRAIEPFASDSDDSCLKLDTRTPPDGSMREHHIDLARRLTLCKALGLPQTFIDAPFRLITQAGESNWEPTDEYIVTRTLSRFLAGKQLVAAMSPAPDTTALIFRGSESSCMVAWSWQDNAAPIDVRMYLGRSPRGFDLTGRPIELPVSGHEARLALGPAPIIVDGLHAPLVLLQASFRIAPTFLQTHYRESQPVVSFRNPFPTSLSGEAVFQGPQEWQITPRVLPFVIGPGETLEQALDLLLPPRQVSSSYELGVTLRLRSPEEAELQFSQRLEFGLREIMVEARTRWVGDTLIVDQSVRNLTTEKIRFTGFCEAAQRSRSEGLFLDIGLGEAHVQTYVYPDARGLVGTKLHLGIREIRGQRRLDQLVEVPGD